MGKSTYIIQTLGTGRGSAGWTIPPFAQLLIQLLCILRPMSHVFAFAGFILKCNSGTRDVRDSTEAVTTCACLCTKIHSRTQKRPRSEFYTPLHKSPITLAVHKNQNTIRSSSQCLGRPWMAGESSASIASTAFLDQLGLLPVGSGGWKERKWNEND